MKISHYAFFLLLFIGTAQNTKKDLLYKLEKATDSEKINIYSELADFYFDKTGKGDSTIYYANKMIQLSKLVDDDINQAKGLSLLGKGYAANKEYEQAETYLKNGLTLAYKNNDTENLAVINNRIAGVYQNLDQIPLAVEHYLKAIALAKEIKTFKIEALSYYGLSVIYNHQDQKEKQLEYLEKAIELCDQNKVENPLTKCLVYGSASQQYQGLFADLKKEEYKELSLYYAEKSLETSKTNDLKQRIPSDITVLSVYHLNNGDIEKSQQYLEEALPYIPYARDATQLNIYQILAHIHRAKGEKELCYKYIDSLNNLPAKEKAIYGAMISKYSHTTYKHFKDYDLAFKAIDEYFEFEKEKKEIEQNKTINELETKYQTELKDTKIERLTFFLIGSLAILLASFLIFYIFRLRKSKEKNRALKEAIKQQLKLEKELVNVRNNIAQDFHDDLGNKLARISFLTRLVEDELSGDDLNLKSKVSQVKEDTVSLYVGTKDFIFSLKPNSDYLEEVVTYLSDFGEDYFSDTKIQFVIDKNINLNKKLPHYWSKQLIFIFKEAMTNAFKYANCDKLFLQFEQNENLLTISCIDNGKGITEDEMKSKNGLLNMKKRAEKIGGTLYINSSSKKGTTVQFIGSTVNN